VDSEFSYSFTIGFKCYLRITHQCVSGDLEKPSLCSLAQKCKHQCGLLEEIVLPSRNMGSLPNAEESPFGLESLFWQESIHESVEYGAPASATTHTENGFGESKGCHVKSALENTHVSEPFSHHDTEENISKIGGCMHTSPQDNGMEGIDISFSPSSIVFFMISMHSCEHVSVWYFLPFKWYP
jgi:hypothetical protein